MKNLLKVGVVGGLIGGLVAAAAVRKIKEMSDDKVKEDVKKEVCDNLNKEELIKDTVDEVKKQARKDIHEAVNEIKNINVNEYCNKLSENLGEKFEDEFKKMNNRLDKMEERLNKIEDVDAKKLEIIKIGVVGAILIGLMAVSKLPGEGVDLPDILGSVCINI